MRGSDFFFCLDCCIFLSSVIQLVDLSGNAIDYVPPLAPVLVALTELNLDGNALRRLGDELLGLPRLKKLSARDNRIAAVDPTTGEQVNLIDARIYINCTLD